MWRFGFFYDCDAYQCERAPEECWANTINSYFVYLKHLQGPTGGFKWPRGGSASGDARLEQDEVSALHLSLSPFQERQTDIFKLGRHEHVFAFNGFLHTSPSVDGESLADFVCFLFCSMNQVHTAAPSSFVTLAVRHTRCSFFLCIYLFQM